MKPGVIVAVLLVLTTAAAAQTDVTREDAVAAIADAEDAVVAGMQVKNTTPRLNESLAEARLALRQATYAEYIRNRTNGSLAPRARAAMEGLDVNGFRYSDVFTHTREVQRLRRTVFNQTDRLAATRARSDDYRAQGVNTSTAEDEIRAAEVAFRESRYEDADSQLVAANQELDAAWERRSVADRIAVSGTGFLAAYGRELIVVVSAILVLGVGGYRVYRRRRDTAQMDKLVRRRQVIGRLMESAQEAYFVNEDIPLSVYEARMDTYRKQLKNTEEDLAVVANRLGRDPP